MTKLETFNKLSKVERKAYTEKQTNIRIIQ